MDKDMKISINKNLKYFNKYFENLLKNSLQRNELSRAIIYGALNGGKRIRPYMVSVFGSIANIKKKHYMRIAAAVECIHSYSLIHDDLPSMDNDDFRRGKPSVHKKFNEAQAILAGDSLHDIAFEIISNKKTHQNSDVRVKLINELSIILGSKGLAGGQSLDIYFERKKIEKKEILNMYRMKTGSLFSYCSIAPFIMAKKNSDEILFAKKYGILFGLIFQIIDDYLDEISNFEKIGKTPGKDKKQGKSTIISVIRKENVIPYCESIIKNFVKKNKVYFKKWPILKNLLETLIYRNN